MFIFTICTMGINKDLIRYVIGEIIRLRKEGVVPMHICNGLASLAYDAKSCNLFCDMFKDNPGYVDVVNGCRVIYFHDNLFDVEIDKEWYFYSE